ncbi:MAG: sulfite oxidase [Variibacter sp.]|nr:sulfite oxidase [Variibacter sp.]
MAPEAERKVLAETKPRLLVIDDAALNAEARPEHLDAPITPIDAFFVRNNGLLPDVAPAQTDAWTLTIDGEVERPQRWTLAELKQQFEVVSVTAVLECAGNGRSGFDPPTDGLQWANGAVACGRWEGVRLADVLAASAPKPSAVYTGHYSPDVMADGSGRPALSRGLPLAKAMAPETLLAFSLNGEPLPTLHGGPLRIVAPGYPGSAWQKWLSRIAIRDREHDGEKMTGTNYRLPRSPLAPGAPINPADFVVITDMPVKSLITFPAEGFVAPAGRPLEVRGFAWSGHTPVASVAVSIDGGATWTEAALESAVDRFAWRRFRIALRPQTQGPVTIAARATDAVGRSQPLGSAPWNPRGYCNNGVHRVSGRIVAG